MASICHCRAMPLYFFLVRSLPSVATVGTCTHVGSSFFLCLPFKKKKFFKKKKKKIDPCVLYTLSCVHCRYSCPSFLSVFQYTPGLHTQTCFFACCLVALPGCPDVISRLPRVLYAHIPVHRINTNLPVYDHIPISCILTPNPSGPASCLHIYRGNKEDSM